MRKLFFLTIMTITLFVSSEDTISPWMADYFERIKRHIDNENYEKAL